MYFLSFFFYTHTHTSSLSCTLRWGRHKRFSSCASISHHLTILSTRVNSHSQSIFSVKSRFTVEAIKFDPSVNTRLNIKGHDSQVFPHTIPPGENNAGGDDRRSCSEAPVMKEMHEQQILWWLPRENNRVIDKA